MATERLDGATIRYGTLIENPHNVTTSELIRAARRYVGLSYISQGRTRRGTDCAGLLLMMGRDLHMSDLEVFAYSNDPDGATFETLLGMAATKIGTKGTWKEDARVGDFMACDYGKGIQHVGLITRIDSLKRVKIIHAKRAWGVVEQYAHGYDLRGWTQTYRVENVVNDLV
jgi:cell wall-associated NlpC family hydrolase